MTQEAVLKAAAVAYTQRGWFVVPIHTIINGACSCGNAACESPGKHPWPSRGLDDATNSQDDAEYFWDKWPLANIGIVCGPSLLAVVDLDGEQAVIRWRALHPDAPRTRTVQTGNGWHLWYQDPTGELKTSYGKGDDAGIELRAGAAYVVAPPSLHHSGRHYELRRDVEPVPLSRAQLGYFEQRRAQNRRPEQAGLRIPQGQRDATLASMAGSMRNKGFITRAIRDAISATNEDCCDPPLDQRDVNRIARSISAYQPGHPSLLHIETIGKPPDDEAASVEHSWLPINLLERALDPPAPPTILGLFYPGRSHVISGEPDALKSMLVLYACATLARQGERSVYVDYEMGPGMILERFRALGLSDAELELITYIEPQEPLGTHDAELVKLLNELQPSLIVVDAFVGTLASHGLDDNSAVDVERWYATVARALRSSGAALVILDHVVKDADKRGKYALGSGRKIGGVDVHLSIEVRTELSRGGTGSSSIITKKDRPGHHQRGTLGTITARSHPDGQLDITIDLATPRPPGEAPPAWRPTFLMERVSRHVEQFTGHTRNEINGSVNGRKATILDAISVLLAEGFLVEAREGQARHYASQKPYREITDPASTAYLQITQQSPVPTGSQPVPGTGESTGSPVPPPSGGTGTGDEAIGTTNRFPPNEKLPHYDPATGETLDGKDWNPA